MIRKKRQKIVDVSSFNVEVKEVGFDNEISILCGVRIDHVSNNPNKRFPTHNLVT